MTVHRTPETEDTAEPAETAETAEPAEPTDAPHGATADRPGPTVDRLLSLIHI